MTGTNLLAVWLAALLRADRRGRGQRGSKEQATAAFRNSLPLLFLDQMPGPWTPRLLGGLLKTRTTRPT